MMRGISHHHRREVGVNLTGGRTNSVEICQKILGAPKLDDMLKAFQEERGLPINVPDQRFVQKYGLSKPEKKEATGEDDVIITDGHGFQWGRTGGYEVSTKGDRRFSALVSRLSDGFTIEEHYQLRLKGHGALGVDEWKVGKGKAPVGHWPGDTLYEAYRDLWFQWADENPALIDELRHKARQHDGMLSDQFATTPISQARALADVLNTKFDSSQGEPLDGTWASAA